MNSNVTADDTGKVPRLHERTVAMWVSTPYGWQSEACEAGLLGLT